MTFPRKRFVGLAATKQSFFSEHSAQFIFGYSITVSYTLSTIKNHNMTYIHVRRYQLSFRLSKSCLVLLRSVPIFGLLQPLSETAINHTE